jgi:peptidoglycan/LPS O-acetylase OafA/YrhL
LRRRPAPQSREVGHGRIGVLKRIAFVDGLRGIAILAVVFHHSFARYFNYGVGTTHGGLLAEVASSGFLGVNLFFVLSGFVLYLPYLTGARRIDETGAVARFFRHRVRRLYPLYLFVTIVSLLFVLVDPTIRQLAIWAILHVTVLFPFHPKTFLPSANWVMWSLGLEFWFSALFPVLVWLAQRYSIAKVLTVSVGLGIIVRAIGYADVLPALRSAGDTYFLSNSVAGRLDDFVFGMLAADLFVKRAPRGNTGASLRLAAAAVLTMTVFHLWALWTRREIPIVSASLFSLPLNIAMTLVILEIARFRVLRVALESRGLRLLGMMCYSIYLWHGIVLARFGETSSTAAGYAAYLGAVLLLSWFTYRYIEFSHVKSFRDVLPRPLGPADRLAVAT